MSKTAVRLPWMTTRTCSFYKRNKGSSDGEMDQANISKGASLSRLVTLRHPSLALLPSTSAASQGSTPKRRSSLASKAKGRPTTVK